ncbi:Quinone oxidoreductase 2 [Pseudocercospora fuligena]|uniref:Quinone oxidoreductase 2 n=1 Tax=Pseudocercospora fuligena TaxID=685502 RepID=A0A8H6RWB9_9PEZI|nr:Quinone oxidoreductase 2 [Pseudocercospora fuligena]
MTLPANGRQRDLRHICKLVCSMTVISSTKLNDVFPIPARGASKLRSKSSEIEIRRAHWDDPSSWLSGLQDVSKLFLISSARIEKDFNSAPPGKGREEDHFRALEAAKKVGVKHVYYTSLAFANPSLSGVMKAHERTEEYLQQQKDFKFTIIREGLYNESWPLYLGHYDLPGGDDRTEVVVAGDSKISWTSIRDLGLANALILAAPSEEYEGKMFYLAQKQAYTMKDVAEMVAKARGKELKLKVLDRESHEEYYVNERKMERPFIEWWSKTYDALKQNECEIHDNTLEGLLKSRGVEPTAMEVTVEEMVGSSRGFTGR